MDFEFTLKEGYDDMSPTYLKSRLVNTHPKWVAQSLLVSQGFDLTIQGLLDLDNKQIQYISWWRQSRVFLIEIKGSKYVIKVHQHSYIALSDDKEYRESYTDDYEKSEALKWVRVSLIKQGISVRFARVFFATPYVLVQEYVPWECVRESEWKNIDWDLACIIWDEIRKLTTSNRQLWRNTTFDNYARNIVQSATEPWTMVIVDPFRKIWTL